MRLLGVERVEDLGPQHVCLVNPFSDFNAYTNPLTQ